MDIGGAIAAWAGDNGENRRPLQWRIVSNVALPWSRILRKFALPAPRIALMEWITQPEAWIALFTLTMLEIVLGIDNIIFISILVDRLPEHQQKKARLTGLALAMVLRILLLLSISWVMNAQNTLFTIGSVDPELKPIAEELIINE